MFPFEYKNVKIEELEILKEKHLMNFESRKYGGRCVGIEDLKNSKVFMNRKEIISLTDFNSIENLIEKSLFSI